VTWPVVPLNELQAEEPRAITDGPFGSNLASRHYTEHGPRVVRLQNIGDGHFVDEKAHIAQEHFEFLRTHEVLAGDLLVASLGEVLPRACLAPPTLGPAIVKADCIRVRLRRGVEPRWVMYAMQRPEVRRWADSHRHGVGRPRLGLKMIRQIPVPLPSLDEQRRVVEQLEDHLSRLDAADEYVRTGFARAQAWHAKVIDQLVWSPGYPRKEVRSLLREPMRNGRSDRAVQGSDGGTRTLTLTAVTRNSFIEEHTKLTTTTRDRAAGLWLEPGDVLVQRSNTPELVGTSARFDGPRNWAIFPDLLIRLRADESLVDSRYLSAALRSHQGHVQLRRRAKGAAGSMPKIDQEAVGSVLIPLPSGEDQGQIVAQVAAADNGLRQLHAELEAAQQRSTTLRRSLLDAAFSGRLTEAYAETATA